MSETLENFLLYWENQTNNHNILLHLVNSTKMNISAW